MVGHTIALATALGEFMTLKRSSRALCIRPIRPLSGIFRRNTRMLKRCIRRLGICGGHCVEMPLAVGRDRF